MAPGGIPTPLSVRDLAARTDLFAGVAAFRQLDRDARQGVPGTADYLREGAVSPNFFEVLGVDGPAAGTWDIGATPEDLPVVLTSTGARVLSVDDRRPGRRLDRKVAPHFRVYGHTSADFVYPTNYGQADALVPFRPADAYTVVKMPGGGFSVTENYLLLARLK